MQVQYCINYHSPVQLAKPQNELPLLAGAPIRPSPHFSLFSTLPYLQILATYVALPQTLELTLHRLKHLLLSSPHVRCQACALDDIELRVQRIEPVALYAQAIISAAGKHH